MAKFLFWFWFIILLILNIIPLNSGKSGNLNSSRLGFFRLDYLVHMVTFLAFAWVYLLGQVTQKPIFENQRLLKFACIVILSSVGFELMQLMVPTRAYNYLDLSYNLIGALLGIIFIVFSESFSNDQYQMSKKSDNL